MCAERNLSRGEEFRLTETLSIPLSMSSRGGEPAKEVLVLEAGVVVVVVNDCKENQTFIAVRPVDRQLAERLQGCWVLAPRSNLAEDMFALAGREEE